MQSFAIPGPVFLSILSGALFGAVPGFLLVCFVTFHYFKLKIKILNLKSAPLQELAFVMDCHILLEDKLF
jgi:hypothetical protein